MEPTELKIEISDQEAVTGLLYPARKPDRKGVTIVLGHGAGANQLSGFMRMFAAGLAERGIDAVTFNFLYMEQGRKMPDTKPRLESCYQAVIDTIRKHRKLKSNRLVIGGKSMGGRIASQVAAANGDGISGLVFLGYPLHPPGRPEKLRAEHLKDIRAPMLFVQGSRDAFGTPEELQVIFKQMNLKAELYEISGGDHSFKVPKSSGSQELVYEAALNKVADWVRASGE